MADNEEEEPNPQPHHVRNYYGESDTFNGVRLNAKRRKETSSCWPNQKCLSGIIMQRIVYSLGKQDLKLSDFVEFGFQVNIYCKLFDFLVLIKTSSFKTKIWTANRLVLESQTFNRMIEAEGVLPSHISELINTPFEGKTCRLL